MDWSRQFVEFAAPVCWEAEVAENLQLPQLGPVTRAWPARICGQESTNETFLKAKTQKGVVEVVRTPANLDAVRLD